MQFEFLSILFDDSSAKSQPTGCSSWGPDASAASKTQLDCDIPYAPFSKNERLGRVVDWTTGGDSRKNDHHSGNVGGHGNRSRIISTTIGDLGSSTTEEPAFSVVEVRTSIPKNTARPKPIRGPAQSSSTVGHRGASTTSGFRGRGGGRGRGGWGGRAFDRNQRQKEPSVVVASNWRLLEEIEFSRLLKLQLDPDEPQVMLEKGSLQVYDRSADRLTTKTERAIIGEESPRRLVNPDSEMVRLAEEHGANVIGTDVIIALLMSTPRTVCPWDIQIRKTGNILIFERREDSMIDFPTVNETAHEAPLDDRDNINSAPALANELARITRSLSSALCKADDVKVYGDSASSNTMHRYTILSLGDDVKMILCAEVNGLSRNTSASEIPIMIRALLEYDFTRSGSIDWRTRLDQQRGAALAAEIKNNSAQLSRYVFQALLSATPLLKIAFVSRVSPKDRSRHVILGVQEHEPEDLATQMNLNTANGYGILKAIIDLVRLLPQGKYLLARDPNKPILRLYDIPNS